MDGTDYVNFHQRALYGFVPGPRARPLHRLGVQPIRRFFWEAYSTLRYARNALVLERRSPLEQFYPNEGFMYLHFMSWHSNLCFASQAHVRPGAAAPWSHSTRSCGWTGETPGGRIHVRRAGIEPIAADLS